MLLRLLKLLLIITEENGVANQKCSLLSSVHFVSRFCTQKSLWSFGLLPQPLLPCTERRDTSYPLSSSFTLCFPFPCRWKAAHPDLQALLSMFYSHLSKAVTEEWWMEAKRCPWIWVPLLAGIIKYMMNSAKYVSITSDISRNPFLFHRQLMNPKMMAVTIPVSFKVLLI